MELLRNNLAGYEFSGDMVDYEWGRKPYEAKIYNDGYEFLYWNYSRELLGMDKASWNKILQEDSEEQEAFLDYNPLVMIRKALENGNDFSSKKIEEDIVL